MGFGVPATPGYTTLSGAVDQSTSSTTRYGAFVDVTKLVAAAGSGTYRVANVQTGTGGDRYAGWTLVVAYEDPTQPPRNLTVDDGFITINSSAPPTTIPITGFRTPPTGPVRTTLGFVAYEGDSGLTGDSASLNGTKLSDAANPANNFFNGGITNLGVNVTTRTPNDVNNWDYDSKLVNANGILPNNTTSANILVTTSGDTYYPAVVTLATDLYAPQITSTKTVTNLTHPGGPDQRGDTLRYTVSYTNTGSDAAANFVMRDSIPAGATYVPGSLRVSGSDGSSSPTDALGDDAGEFNPANGEVVFRLGAGGNGTTGGMIRPGATDTATFNVTINPGDTPGQQIVNQATATFTGLTLGTAFSDTSPKVTNTVSAPSLSLAKSHLGGFVAGQATTFLLAVSNVGTLGTSGAVTVTDPFPASSFSAIANANGVGWSCQIFGLTLTCTRSDALAAGNSYPPIFVDGIVQDPAPATISNTATVSGGGSAPASDSDGGGSSGLADLSLTKSADSSLVANGGTVTYTLNVQNSGPSSAQNVVVSDPIDTSSFTDISVQTSQPGGSCDTTVSCSLGTLAANATATITITATVTARDTTVINTATVSSTTPNPNPSNTSASAAITVPPTADLAITKTGPANADQGVAGGDTYTLAVTNNGPDGAHGVVVNDTLPSQFTATSASGPGFTCTLPGGAGGAVVCTDSLLAPTGSTPVQITITGTVANGTAGQTIADAATVSSNSNDPDLTNNTATFSQLVGPAADLTLTKVALVSAGGPQLVNPLSVGSTFVYALGVTNNGPSDAANVVVTDPLPAGMTLASPVPAGCLPNVVGSSGTITCTIGTLAASASTIFNLAVTVGVSANGTAPQDTASVSSTTADPNPTGAESATSTVGVGPVANLALSKSVSPQTASVGDLVTYTFTVTNDIPVGESGGTPVALATTSGTVSDPLPAGLQFVSAAPASTCTDNPGPPETVTCPVGPIAQGQTVTESFLARVTPTDAGTTVQNTASVAPGPGQPVDYNPSDSIGHAGLLVNPQATLSLTKSASNTNPTVDDEVDYNLTASNAGPNDATGVTIVDPLPAGLDFIDATPGCDNENGTVRCDVGTVPAGGSASVTIRTHTTAAIAGMTLANLATATGDDVPSPATAGASITVQPLVDLALTKMASNPTPAAAGPVSYTLTLSNNGPSPASGVTITDPLPSGLTFVSATPGQGVCNTSGQTVTCNLGTLAAGGAAVVSITADVAASAAGVTLQNTATASANEPIAQPELLSSRAIVNPIAAPVTEADLDVTKTVNHTHAPFGTELAYTITITNHGPATAANPTVTDAFSAAVHVISVHSSSGSCSKQKPIKCKLASVATGAAATIKIAAKPQTVGVLRNTASVATPTPLTPASRTLATATSKITPGPHSHIMLDDTATPPAIPPGGTATFMPKISNPNPWPLNNVRVCDRLPAGTKFVAASLGATQTRRLVCWRIATLPARASKSLWVSAEPLLGVTGPLRDSAVATASPAGHRLAAHASAEVLVTPAGPCASARDLPHERSPPGPLAVAAC